jgi:hypothetical protein
MIAQPPKVDAGSPSGSRAAATQQSPGASVTNGMGAVAVADAAEDRAEIDSRDLRRLRGVLGHVPGHHDLRQATVDGDRPDVELLAPPQRPRRDPTTTRNTDHDPADGDPECTLQHRDGGPERRR